MVVITGGIDYYYKLAKDSQHSFPTSNPPLSIYPTLSLLSPSLPCILASNLEKLSTMSYKNPQ